MTVVMYRSQQRGRRGQRIIAELLRLQEIAIFMFKVKHRLLPSNVLKLFPRSPSS